MRKEDVIQIRLDDSYAGLLRYVFIILVSVCFTSHIDERKWLGARISHSG